MNFIEACIRNPVKVSVGVLLAVLFGLVSLFGTPVQLTPEVIEPQITVSTRWPGASAQEVEREIVEEQEEQLKSVEGLKEFKSESTDSLGTIIMKFDVGVDLADARAKVSDKLNQVRDYPDDVQEPTITTVDPNANAIAWFILTPLAPSADELETFLRLNPDAALEEALRPMIDRPETIDIAYLNKLAQKHPALLPLVEGRSDPTKMRKFAEDTIEARFERVEGIANANVLGGREEEFRVIVDPARLAAAKLTIADVRRAVQAQNKNTSAGDIQEGMLRNVVRTIGQYKSPEEVADTIVARRENELIRVRDLGTVGIDYRKPDGVVRQKGVASLAINAQQAPYTNVLEIMGPPMADLDLNGDGELTQLELSEAKLIYGDCLRIALAELNIGILRQKGLSLEQVYDQTEYIHSATDLVIGNIYVGGGLAVLVLLLFLRSVRSVLIIGLAIPISVIATFLFIRAFGRSINVISLAGMAFAVGMVVDNAIVVLENIYRHYQLGEQPDEAARKGALEVWGAVLASTATTLAVFIPVIFQQGQAGQLFKDIAIAISCAVGLSLIVSVTVVPVAAQRLLRRRRTGGDMFQPPSLFGLVPLATRATNAFARGLEAMMRGRMNFLKRLVVVALFVTGSLLGARMLQPETEYLPEGNRNLVIAILLPPPGYNIDHMIDIGKTIENRLAPYWETPVPENFRDDPMHGLRISSFFFVARGRSLFMGARANDELRASELVPVLSQVATTVPGTFAFVKQASLFESGLSGGRTIDIEITGPDLEVLVREGQKAFGMCAAEFPPFAGNQLRPVPSLDLASPELHVVPHWEKAAELGVTAADLGYAVNALVDGAYAADYWHEGRKIDLVIYGADDFARHTHDVENLPLSTPTGEVVALSTVADVKLSSGPEQVNHIERLRAITIQLTPAPGVPLAAALNTVNEKIRKPLLATPTFESGLYQIRLAGTADKLDQARIDMQWELVLAMVITYLLMAGLFESYFHPLIIMTSIALALVGGFAGLAIVNLFTVQPLDMLTLLGFVILIGTVVNNAILIVHQGLNFMREEGWDDRHAIVESARTRLRPILMTTATTLLGMLPLVVPAPEWKGGELMWAPGAGSELYRGLGAVILGGLSVSTIFTLVLIPVGFTLAMDAKRVVSRIVAVLIPTGAPEPDEALPATDAESAAPPVQEPHVAAAESAATHGAAPDAAARPQRPAPVHAQPNGDASSDGNGHTDSNGAHADEEHQPGQPVSSRRGK